MSVENAIESHIKQCLDDYIPFPGVTHQVVESYRLSDRPLPAVIVQAGAANKAFPNRPDQLGNYRIPVQIVVLSSIDEGNTLEKHMDVADKVAAVMTKTSNRFVSRVQGLHLYDVAFDSQGRDRNGRKMISVLNYTIHCNYSPEPPL